MGRQRARARAEAAASPDAVWRLLADVTTWTDWAGFDEATYEQVGDPPPHGLGAVRRFRVGRLRSTETVLAFDPPRRLSYDYVGSLPVKGYRAEVTLAEHGEGTLITWQSEFDPKLPLTGPLMRLAITRVLRDITTRLAKAAQDGS